VKSATLSRPSSLPACRVPHSALCWLAHCLTKSFIKLEKILLYFRGLGILFNFCFKFFLCSLVMPSSSSAVGKVAAGAGDTICNDTVAALLKIFY
jgi:hypothetical protein